MRENGCFCVYSAEKPKHGSGIVIWSTAVKFMFAVRPWVVVSFTSSWCLETRKITHHHDEICTSNWLQNKVLRARNKRMKTVVFHALAQCFAIFTWLQCKFQIFSIKESTGLCGQLWGDAILTVNQILKTGWCSEREKIATNAGYHFILKPSPTSCDNKVPSNMLQSADHQRLRQHPSKEGTIVEWTAQSAVDVRMGVNSSVISKTLFVQEFRGYRSPDTSFPKEKHRVYAVFINRIPTVQRFIVLRLSLKDQDSKLD